MCVCARFDAIERKLYIMCTRKRVTYHETHKSAETERWASEKEGSYGLAPLSYFPFFLFFFDLCGWESGGTDTVERKYKNTIMRCSSIETSSNVLTLVTKQKMYIYTKRLFFYLFDLFLSKMHPSFECKSTNKQKWRETNESYPQNDWKTKVFWPNKE